MQHELGGDTNIQSIERMVVAGGHRIHRMIIVINPSLHARYTLRYLPGVTVDEVKGLVDFMGIAELGFEPGKPELVDSPMVVLLRSLD